jgi:hypothetical protein
MTTIAHGWEIVSRHKIVDAVVVLFAAVALAVTLALVLGNQSSSAGPGPTPGPSHNFGPACHWTGKPTYC